MHQPVLISQTSVHQYDGHVVLQERVSGPGSVVCTVNQSSGKAFTGTESGHDEHAHLVHAIIKYL